MNYANLAFAAIITGILAMGTVPTYAQSDRPTPPDRPWPAPPNDPDGRPALNSAHPVQHAAQRPDFSRMSIPADAAAAIRGALARGAKLTDHQHDPSSNGRRITVKPAHSSEVIPGDVDLLGSLRLLHAEEQIQGSGGTSCILYANGGGGFNGSYRTVWGQGYQACSSPYWIYYQNQQVYANVCHFQFWGWCFPGASTYEQNLNTCELRYPNAQGGFSCSGAYYPFVHAGGYYFITNSGVVTATDGAAGAVVDSQTFWVD